MHQVFIFLDCRGQILVNKQKKRTTFKFSLRVPPRKEHMCAKYSLPPFDWLKLSHHLVSGESTLHEVTLFEARSRIFLPTAESCAALFRCRLAIRASSLGWLVGKKQTPWQMQIQLKGRVIRTTFSHNLSRHIVALQVEKSYLRSQLVTQQISMLQVAAL